MGISKLLPNGTNDSIQEIDNCPVQVVITGGSGLTTAIFSEVPPLSDDPGLAADVLQLLVAAGKPLAAVPGRSCSKERGIGEKLENYKQLRREKCGAVQNLGVWKGRDEIASRSPTLSSYELLLPPPPPPVPNFLYSIPVQNSTSL
jgi:hypothetical protein